jgi:hypothetical protein
MRRPHLWLLRLWAPALAGLGLAAPLPAAAPPAVHELRVQPVGDVTYFHVVFATPAGMLPDDEARLVPQDAQAGHVCRRVATAVVPTVPGTRPGVDTPRPPVAPQGLEFVGRLSGAGEARFVLLYSTEGRPSRLDRFRPPALRRRPRARWAEAAVTLDFAKATKVDVPPEARERKASPPPKAENKPRVAPTPAWPVRNDLEGLWAVAQAEEFGRLQAEVSEFGFYGFAAQATARKYHVPLRPDLAVGRGMPGVPGGRGAGVLDRQLYETTTGATAVAESLQLQRMLGQGGRDTTPRTVPIDKVEGITVAEHPWEKMMAGKRPADEPVARLVPDDNYYIHFKDVRKFIEFTELLDQWGTNLIRAYEVHSRDHRLKERYQQQLCLKSTELGKKLGPLVLRGLAVTGSDPYLREGSDVALIFHVNNRALFLAAVQPFLDEAGRKFGDQLHRGKEEVDGVKVESFVTPRREVSLYRAVVGDHVVYANSRDGLRRILDTRAGRHKALADALDFQYMRTIFRHDDKEEAGFAYLSDAFIRQLVGPASKIKEKRRLEALTSMYMLTEGALYHAWQTGKPPADHAALLASAALKPEEVYLPEGQPLVWDAKGQVAVSDVYNTLHFATPLVELPVGNVTEAEAQAYRQFRLEYLGLWRRYFDPIGMRIALDDKQVRLDTFILPLVADSRYNELRRVTGDGTVRLDLAAISPKTVAQFLMHLSPNVGDRSALLGLGLGGPRGPGAGGDLMTMLAWGLDPVGKWVLVRADDSPVYGQLADLLDRSEAGGDVDAEQVARLVFRLPVLVGVDVKNPLTFAGALAALRKNVMEAAPGMLTWGPLEETYKGVTIVRVQATPAGMRQVPIAPARPGREPFLPAVYYATIEGAFYLTLNEATLRDFIDRSQAKPAGKAEAVEVNSSLYLAPGAAEKARGFVEKYLEKEVHRQALAGARAWYPLYHTGLLTDGAKASALAEKYYGFVPVSPDGTAYAYDRRTDEVRNERHGSSRRPQTHAALAEGAPLKLLLGQLRALRADLRFREDGIHTTLTIDRQRK